MQFSLLGNLLIGVAKFFAYARTGHSSMFSEAVHTLVDVGNQAVLAWGLYEAEKAPDRQHPYGYGRAAFFYSLLSALTTFGVGALYTGYHATYDLISLHMHPPAGIDTWAVLAVSGIIDGWVLVNAIGNVRRRAGEAGVSPWQWLVSFKVRLCGSRAGSLVWALTQRLWAPRIRSRWLLSSRTRPRWLALRWLLVAFSRLKSRATPCGMPLQVVALLPFLAL